MWNHEFWLKLSLFCLINHSDPPIKGTSPPTEMLILIMHWLINMSGYVNSWLKWMWCEWASGLQKCFLLPCWARIWEIFLELWRCADRTGIFSTFWFQGNNASPDNNASRMPANLWFLFFVVSCLNGQAQTLNQFSFNWDQSHRSPVQRWATSTINFLLFSTSCWDMPVWMIFSGEMASRNASFCSWSLPWQLSQLSIVVAILNRLLKHVSQLTSNKPNQLDNKVENWHYTLGRIPN